MLKYSQLMFMTSLPMYLTAFTFQYNNLFISLDMPILFMYSFFIPLSLMLDWTSLLFMATVLLISSTIIMFSVYYIPKKEHNQFLLMLLMFVFSMLLLILSDNLIFMLLGWDGLGMSSFILVIYYQNYTSVSSGSLTLISNRIGDIMILMSISVILMNANWNFNMNKEYNLISMLLLVTAASSKSAQFPFSAWLPAAMAAPTPISALVHSSTLVTAGVFLLIRIMNNIHPITLFLLMLISSLTTLYSSMAANWEQDLKKIIALSTLSQIAMMMFALSMKFPMLAFFHLIVHALFKSTLFLCAGVMIHNSSYQDMRMMGMNSFNIPITHTILGVSNMALVAIPFTSGFFSKDAIIESMMSSSMNQMLSFIMIMSVGMTATYTLRMSTLSMSPLYKSKPELNNHNMFLPNTSLFIMSPFSIITGASMMWMNNPQQLFLIPSKMKMLIIMMLMLGMMLGTYLSFNKKLFLKMGTSSISLWFIHLISTTPMMLFSPLMNTSSYNDKSWQELYGPSGKFFLIKNISKIPDTMNTSLLFILIMILMMPFIM